MEADAMSGFRERQALHAAIVRESPNPIFLVDAETRRLRDANPALERLLRYSQAELLGMDLHNIDLGPRFEQDRLVSRIIGEHHDILGERSFRRSDGTVVPVEASANLVIYEGRQVLCVFARDISSRKESERETARLQRQLSLSQKHEAVGRLAAGIAHDFNNQLTVMLLCAQLIESRLVPDDPSLDELAEIAAAGRSAADLIRQLLAFSGRQLLRPQVVALDETLVNLGRMVGRVVGEDIELVTQYEADGASVFADPTQLEQVVVNLVVNARDAMPGGGTLTLSTQVVEVGDDFIDDYVTLKPGTHVLLKVSDTGVGIPEDAMEQIFEPFFTTKEQGRGTGLGLATVYGIVKQSGGSIWVSSSPDTGATFRIYLPLVEEESQVVDESGWEEQAPPPVGTETILLVEDEDMVRVLTARILRDLGYTIIEAEGPGEAQRLFYEAQDRRRPGGIDLVLTDIIMPEMSGPDLIRLLIQRQEDLRVLFMSGYSYGRMQAEDLFSTRYTCLEKPLMRDTLAHAVRQALDS